MTPEEVERMLVVHDKILNGDNGRFIRREVYDRDLHHLGEDVSEIKDSIRWALRLVVTQFLGLIVTIVVVILTSQAA